MISLPYDEVPVACGWPWHGLVTRDSATATWRIALPNGGVYSFPGNRFNPSSNSFLFDMGLPDIPSPDIEQAGGAWWGRAILRAEIPGPFSTAGDGSVALPALDYGRGLSPEIGAERYLWGAPLVIHSADAELPPFRVFCRAFVRANVLHVSVRHGAQVFSIARAVTAADIGQGPGQPEAAGHGQAPPNATYVERQITDAYPGRFKAFVRDFHGNRLLLGVVAVADYDAPAAQPPLSAVSTGVAGNWPASIFPLFGLLEVEILPSLFEAGVTPDDAVVFRVLEDRRSALGQPLFEMGDVPLPSSGRQYFATWTQSSGLLNAFYDSSGAVQTIRYSRVQHSTLHRRQVEGEGGTFYTQQDTARTTTLQLFGVSGAQVDEFTLSESLVEISRGPSMRVIRTVTATGDTDDVQDSGDVTGTPSWAAPLDVYMPGFHMFAPCITQLYRVNGVDIIQPQDIRVAWIVAHGNRMGCLAFTREPFTTTAGNPVHIQMRKIATPAGVVDDVLSVVESKPIGFPNLRSFFLFTGRLSGAYNPVTGEHTRGPGTWV